MGNKVGSLKKKEIRDLSRMTRFEEDEITALHAQFMSLKKSPSEELIITQREFQQALGFSPEAESLFVTRVFSLFDENNDGFINFPEFLVGIAMLSPIGTRDQKLKFSFQVFDLDNDGRISKSELAKVLEASLKENAINLTSTQLEKMVNDTFEVADTNKDNYVDFEEYKIMVDKNPNILKPFNLNVSEIIQEARAALEGGGGGTA